MCSTSGTNASGFSGRAAADGRAGQRLNFLFGGEDEQEIRYSLPFNPLRDPKLMEELRQSDSGVQFSHTLEEQIRGQLQAGFRLLDLYEDMNGSGFLHEHGVPTFWATLAQK